MFVVTGQIREADSLCMAVQVSSRMSRFPSTRRCSFVYVLIKLSLVLLNMNHENKVNLSSAQKRLNLLSN